MAIEQKVYRRLICDSCYKPLTKYEEASAYDLRKDYYGSGSSKNMDYCNKCGPRSRPKPKPKPKIQKRKMKRKSN